MPIGAITYRDSAIANEIKIGEEINRAPMKRPETCVSLILGLYRWFLRVIHEHSFAKIFAERRVVYQRSAAEYYPILFRLD